MNKLKPLLIATHNQAKFRELKAILESSGYTTISLNDLGITHDVEETGTTLEENAILKAKAYAHMTGLPTLADDSGLMIDALNGEPGVYSARYAGPNKTDKEKRDFVFEKMKNVPAGKRQAYFASVLALAKPDGNVHAFGAELHGSIALEPKGEIVSGYPYTSIFYVPELGITLAEVTFEEKVKISHRLKAMKKLLAHLDELLK